MNTKANYILSEYYRLYDKVREYPYLASEKLGADCKVIKDHDKCCALHKSIFLSLCGLLDVFEEKDIDYLLCSNNRVSGTVGIRAGNVDKPDEVDMRADVFVKFAVLSVFTQQFIKKASLLESWVKILNGKSDLYDNESKEFLSDYVDSGNHITCNTDIGTMISQIFNIRNRYDNSLVVSYVDIDRVEQYIKQQLKQRKKQMKNICTYGKRQGL